MKVVKKINNNVAVCLDSNNCELVAFGKGIGFPKMPYEIQDLSLIDRTFYDLDSHIMSLFNEIPDPVMQVSMEIVDKAKVYMNTNLPKEEEANIAMHFINAQLVAKKQDEESDLTRMIEDVTSIVEKELNLLINRDDFNYSRFIIHLQYLLKRKDKKVVIHTSNLKMFEKMKEEYVDVYQCVLKIKEYFEKILNWQLNDEELLYLMLHINRFYSREGL